jgi:hypothetical protein
MVMLMSWGYLFCLRLFVLWRLALLTLTLTAIRDTLTPIHDTPTLTLALTQK